MRHSSSLLRNQLMICLFPVEKLTADQRTALGALTLAPLWPWMTNSFDCVSFVGEGQPNSGGCTYIDGLCEVASGDRRNMSVCLTRRLSEI